mgnify:CR=1 FL=1|jgi:hypothetical protein
MPFIRAYFPIAAGTKKLALGLKYKGFAANKNILILC